MNDAIIRPGRDDDAAGFIAVIGGCWAEYPGCVMDVDGEVPELRALASHYQAKGGVLWAAEAAGQLVGVVGTAALADGAAGWEISRMYVARAYRGTGLAHRLLDQAEAHARAAGARRLVLWSDTRFEAAHRFYEKRGFARAGAIRVLDDLSHSLEFRYAKPLAGLVVEGMDAAAAASVERSLAELQLACGAPEGRRGFWRKMAAEVATGGRVLLVAWLDGAIVGTVMLDLDTPPDQRHRAEVEMLLVHPRARGRGVGGALMRQAEQAASRAGRWLLTLGTNDGDGLFSTLGWTRAGVIPGYALDAQGVPCARRLFYRTLAVAG